MEGAIEAWVDEGMAAAIDLLGDNSWRATRLPGTGGGTFGSVVFRLENGNESAIAKVVRRNEFPRDNALYWERELLVYESDWLSTVLPAELRLPGLRGVARTSESGVIVLEAVPFDDRQQRDFAWYHELAGSLAKLNAVSVHVDETPDWLTRDFLGTEARAAAETIPEMLAKPSHHLTTVLNAWRPIIDRVATDHTAIVDSLGFLPVGPNHLDAFSRNAARVHSKFVMIDWAHLGIAPLGCDAAGVIAMGVMHSDVPANDVDAFFESVVHGYVDGLAAAGQEISEDQLADAIAIEVALRFARFLGQANSAGDAIPGIVEALNELPFQQVMPQLTADSESLCQRALEALEGRP